MSREMLWSLTLWPFNNVFILYLLEDRNHMMKPMSVHSLPINKLDMAIATSGDFWIKHKREV